MKKRALSLLMVLLLMQAVLPSFVITASALQGITEAEVIERLSSAEERWKNGSRYDDSKQKCKQCFGFCRELFDYVFHASLPTLVNRENARLAENTFMENVMEIGHLSKGYTVEDLKMLLSEAKPGDVLIASNASKQHFMMIRSISSDGSLIYVYDANSDGKNGIKTNAMQSANGLRSSRPIAVTLYRYKNYDVANGSINNIGSNTASSSPTTLTFTDITTPGDLTIGSSGHVGGSITSSNSPICSVKAEVLNIAGQVQLTATTSGFSVSKYGPISGSKIDKNLAFGKLPAGTYYIRYTATTRDGTSDSASTSTFEIRGRNSTSQTQVPNSTPPVPDINPHSTTLTFNSLTTPGDLIVGNGGHVDGSITSSNSPINSVKAEVFNSAGQVELTATTSGFSVSTYGPIRGSKIDKNLTFGKLPADTYYIRYTATTKDGTSDSASTSTFEIRSRNSTPQNQTPVEDNRSQMITITFDGNGGTVTRWSSVVISQGNCLGSMPSASRSGYNFDGWYSDPNGGVQVTSSDSLSSDQTLYAHWTAAQVEERWTDWSEWSSAPAYASDTRQVETQQVKGSDDRTEYRYGRYVDSTGTHDCWCARYLEGLPYVSGSAILQYSDWSSTQYSANGKGWSCGYCNGNHTGVDHVGSDGRSWWAEYLLPNGSFYWEETRTVPGDYETQYRYRDRIDY